MKKNASHIVVLVCALALAIGAVALVWPLSDSFGWPLDYAGGTAWTLKPSSSDDVDTSDGKVIEARVKKADLAGSEVAVQDDGSVTVSVPSNQEASEALAYIGKKGVVELVRLDQVSDAEALAKIRNGASNVKLTEGTYTALITADGIKGASVPEGYGTYVTLTFTSAASKTFQEATAELADVYGQIALVMDGEVIASSTVYQEMTGGQVSLSSGLTESQTAALAAVIDSGSISCDYTVDGSTTVDARISVGVAAGIVALFAVVVLVATVVRGKKFGFAAWVAWVFAAVYQFGLVGLIAKDMDMVPGILNIMLVLVSTSCATGFVSTLAADLAKGKKLDGLVSAHVKDLGICIVAVVALAVVGAVFGLVQNDGLGMTWSMLLALPAAFVAAILVFIPIVNIMGSSTKPAKK